MNAVGKNIYKSYEIGCPMQSSKMLFGKLRADLWFALLGLGTVGCGAEEKRPDTVPVTGQIVFQGGKPLSGGLVQFCALDKSQLTIMGEVQSDGNFALMTSAGRGKARGAVPGDYKVIILPASDKKTVEPVSLKDKITVRATGENRLSLTIPASK